MPTPTERPSPPSADRRWKLVEVAMRRTGYAPHGLIEALHAAQESFGYVDLEAMRWVSASLGVPPSRAYGVATFYHFFSLKPQGEHVCTVCLGTACYIRGAAALLASLESSLGVKAGGTTPDGKVSLLTARCLGSCGLAPAAVYDGEVAGKQDASVALARVGAWSAT